MSKINKTPIETRLAIERRSAAMLPDRPTQAGYKPWEIRNALFSAIIAEKGACIMGEIDRIVDEANAAIDALKEKITTAGTITIPVSAWDYLMPTKAYVSIQGGEALTLGGLLLVMPGDTATKDECERARVRIDIDLITDQQPPSVDQIVFVRAEEIPAIPLNFKYFVLKTESQQGAMVALIGVDAYGEGGGTASGVDEEAVKAIITAMLGNVENVRQYSAKNPPPYPVTKVNGQTGEVNLPIPSEAADVKADPAGTAETMTAALREEVNGKLADYDKSTAVNNKISSHNTSTESHADLRLELQRLADRLNAALNSDDTSLDDLKEIVAYIKSNKTLIDGITSSKVNVTDIVNNLTTNTANVPLSAAQGVVLKLLIDSLEDVVEGKTTAEQVAADIADALKGYQPKGDYLTTADAPAIINTEVNKVVNERKEDLQGEPGKDGKTPEAGVDYPTVEQVDSYIAAEVQRRVESGELDGKDGDTPVPGVDYPTDAQIDAKIAAALAERNQLEPLRAESAEWLNENGDPSKVYIVPNTDGQGGKVYAYAEVETVLEGDDVLADNPWLGEMGYQDTNVGVVTGHRLSSDGTSGTSSTVNANALTTGFIPCSDNDILIIIGWRGFKSISMNIVAYDANKAKLAHKGIAAAESNGYIFYQSLNNWATYTAADDTFVTGTLTSVFGVTGIAYVRLSAAASVEDTMKVYVNKSSVVDTVADWYAFADFVPTADARIDELDRRLRVVESGAVGAVDMRTWDKPIYDTAPVVLIGDDTDPTKAKPAVGDRNTVQSVYDAYDALITAYPRYITKTDYKDKTVDGQTLYRYDIQAPKPHEHSGAGNPAIVKPKIILISGIHYEWVGIWSLFHALEEIMTNPDLRDIRRNAHLIVVPVCNPYCLSGPYSATNGRKNANGVEIHRNFAVDHAVIDSTSDNYGGAEPLSEVETQHIDSILAANPDAVAFVSCHNFDAGGGRDYGTSFMWASTATNYLYNLGGRFGVKMSESWEDKYGDTFRANIDANKTALQPDGDYTVGMAGKSTTPGTEAKQCLLYGIQGMTFEVGGDMVALGGAAGDSVTVTRGAEVYANLIRTLLGAYDPSDKKACKYLT